MAGVVRVLQWFSHQREGVDMEANDRPENHEPRDVSMLVVPSVGGVGVLGELPGVAVFDAAGEPVPAIGDFHVGTSDSRRGA